MHFRSTGELAGLIARSLYKIPADVDLIVGIPRSGLLAASLIALDLNLPLTDVDGFIAGRIFGSGKNRASERWISNVKEARHVLLVDDSVNSGAALAAVQRRLESSDIRCKITVVAAYASDKGKKLVDQYFEVCPMPRVFGWNYMHHDNLAHCCVDIDGVLCVDPLDSENDDGSAYSDFLRGAQVLRVPTKEIGWLVTSRLGKYRAETERWLAEHKVRYRELVMLEGVTARERRELQLHASFKGSVYRAVEAELFIESDAVQAPRIASISGKPVLCSETQELVMPKLSPVSLEQDCLRTVRRLTRKLRSKLYAFRRL